MEGKENCEASKCPAGAGRPQSLHNKPSASHPAGSSKNRARVPLADITGLFVSHVSIVRGRARCGGERRRTRRARVCARVRAARRLRSNPLAVPCSPALSAAGRAAPEPTVPGCWAAHNAGAASEGAATGFSNSKPAVGLALSVACGGMQAPIAAAHITVP
jgi:hypothetical protein